MGGNEQTPQREIDTDRSNTSIVELTVNHFLKSLKETDLISEDAIGELTILAKSNNLSKEDDVKNIIKP